MTGAHTPAIAQGTLLSILFARANSIAQAEPGAAKRAEAGWEGKPAEIEADDPVFVSRRVGERIGEENERR